MQTLTHPRSGETILGVRLPPGTRIGENDLYDSSDGKWRTAGLIAGCQVPVGNRVVWVRQPGPLSNNGRTLLGYLCHQPRGEKACIGERNSRFYVIPSPTFNWDGRFDIETMRVRHSECVQELVDHGYLTVGEHNTTNGMSGYSTVRESHENQVYVLTDEGKQKGKEILAS